MEGQREKVGKCSFGGHGLGQDAADEAYFDGKVDETFAKKHCHVLLTVNWEMVVGKPSCSLLPCHFPIRICLLILYFAEPPQCHGTPSHINNLRSLMQWRLQWELNLSRNRLLSDQAPTDSDPNQISRVSIIRI